MVGTRFSTARAGLAAGIVATVCEAWWSNAETALLGRRPVFDTTDLARRLAMRWAGTALDERSARRWGTAMRALYGPSWSLAWTVATGRRRLSPAFSIVALGAAIWITELATMPAIGATPPLRQWAPVEIALDATNAMLFASLTVGVGTAIG